METRDGIDGLPSWRHDLSFSTYITPFEYRIDTDYSLVEPNIDEVDYMSQLLMGFETYINDLNDPDFKQSEILQFQQYRAGVLAKLFAKFFNDNSEDYIEILNIDIDQDSSINTALSTLYSFLFVDRFVNVLNFIAQYIVRNRKNIATNYRETMNPKTLQLIRQSYSGDKLDTKIIICNISDIVDSIADESHDSEAFKEIIINADRYRMSNYVIAADEFFNLTPEFIKLYIEKILENTATRVFLLSQLGNFLNNQYKGKEEDNE